MPDDPSLHPVFDRPLKREAVVFTEELCAALGEKLALGLQELGLETSEAQRQTLVSSLVFLSEWNAVVNLTAIRDPHDMLVQHLLDSLSILPHLPAGVPGKTTTLLDVGSGGGFPALPLAVLRPDLTVVSIDSVRKKTDYVGKAATYLDLLNLRAVHSRVEDHRETYDVVLSRAYASLREFVKSAGHASPRDGTGVFLAMKGKPPDEEIAALAKSGWRAERTLPLSVPFLDAARSLLWLKRAAK